MQLVRWLHARDPGLFALRRAARAAIVVPAVLAIADQLIGNPTVAIFAAIGAQSMLLFVDFTGPTAERVQAQLGLAAVGLVMVSIATLCSRHVWLAAVSTVVVTFLILFAGIVSSVLAGATNALLISYVLPVTLPVPPSLLPDRLYGWLLAGAAVLIAILVLWPAPTREPLRGEIAQACRLLAQRLRAEVDFVRAGGPRAALLALDDQAGAAVVALRRAFFRTPYRPTGLSTSDRALVRLVDELVWLRAVLARVPVDAPRAPSDDAVCDVRLAAATLLERGARLLESAHGRMDGLEPELEQVAEARAVMERVVTSLLPEHPAPAGAGDMAGFVSSLESSFRAHELSFAIIEIALNIELTVAARSRGWWDRVLGRQPAGVGSLLSAAQERAGAHVERHSVWLHNSIRGAIGLALAVLVAELIGVQHSFWVVFGTMAVLRSNAMNTGVNALRGLLGTVVGIIIGGGLIYLVGNHVTVFWLLLPVAVLFTGLAPAAFSFAAGQAGFTATLLILFNIIEPSGWQIGLVRIEDVAIGCGVSLVVGLLFWPRGAVSVLGQALSEAFADSTEYLRRAVEYGISRCDAVLISAPAPQQERRRAAAAARRLDDAFRGFLAERGTKHLALADVTTLINAVAVLRLTADAIQDLWDRDQSSTGDRTAARAEINRTGLQLVGWYEQLSRALVGAGAVPNQLEPDRRATDRLVGAVRRDLYGEDGQATATAVKMIWTADHLDATRRLQAEILAPARAAAVNGLPRSWLLGPPQQPDVVGAAA